jgi:16S rRNA (adenine1518-N6/adenine1519-N6)-dimethyltransferase
MNSRTRPLDRPRKRFGQHFLEPAWVEKLVASIAPERDDVFIEVGPGPGVLTRPLAARSRHVIAVEIDRNLSARLRQASLPNLTLIEGDFLDLTADQIRDALDRIGNHGTLRGAGNLPYNVASPMLAHFSGLYLAGLPIQDATVMLQREVADRLAAPPGSREYGVPSILIGQIAVVRRLFTLPPGAFRPPPKVDSAVVRLSFHPPEPAARNPAIFVALVQAIFTRRRKMLVNALRAFSPGASVSPGTALERAGLDGRRRPETLTVAELVRLADAFDALLGDGGLAARR